MPGHVGFDDLREEGNGGEAGGKRADQKYIIHKCVISSKALPPARSFYLYP